MNLIDKFTQMLSAINEESESVLQLVSKVA